MGGKLWGNPVNIFLGLSFLFLLGIITSCGCMGPDTSTKFLDPGIPERPILITDRLNNTVAIQHPATRIVTTSTYATEYLVLIGADDAIIGVNSNIKDNPLFDGHLNHAEIVGSSGNPSLEKVVALHPDAVILPVETSEAVKTKLNASGIKAVYFDFYSLDALPETVRAIGILTGNRDRAEKYLEFYEKYNDTLTSRLHDIPEKNRCRVYYEMSNDYSTSGKGSGGYNYLQKLKANNAAANLPVSYPVVSPEWLIAEDPEVIIKLCVQDGSQTSLKSVYDSLTLRPEWNDIVAGKNNRTYIVSTNILYGPRVIIGLITLGKIIYPDEFDDIYPDTILDEFASVFFDGANRTETIYPGLS